MLATDSSSDLDRLILRHLPIHAHLRIGRLVNEGDVDLFGAQAESCRN